MRPLKIEFQAFGPYAGYECVDFEEIASKGLFLVCGKTGTGKTMILDAMTFALFGKSSGNGRDDFSSMRCTKADDTTPTFVRFEFENNGKYYLFERKLVKKRVNYSEEYNASVKLPDGSWSPMFENAKAKLLNDKAEEIIGLNYSQFVQVIILPQGKFEKLLTSNSDEKEKILTSIFGEEKWQEIADIIYDNAAKQKEDVRVIKETIERSLKEEQCENIEELGALIEQKKTELKALNSEYANNKYEAKIKEYNENLSLLKKVEEAENLIETRQAEYERAVEATENKKVEYEKTEELLKNHIANEAEIENKKKQIAQYESKKSDYETIYELERNLLEKKADEKVVKKELDSAFEKMESYKPILENLVNEFKVLQNEQKELFDRYLAGITGEIASTLVDGEACPVCGSTTHPKKACVLEGDVTRQQVDDKKAECEEKDLEIEKNKNLSEKAKAAYDVKKEAYLKIEAENKAEEARIESTKVGLIKGIDSLDELISKIRVLQKEIDEYARKKSQLENSEKAQKELFIEAKAKIEAAEKESKNAKEHLANVKEQVKKALVENGFASFDTTEEMAKAADEIENNIYELEGYVKDYTAKSSVLDNEIKRLIKKQEYLLAQGDGIEDKIRQADEDMQFAKKLRGDTGTSLQRYVLGIMFSSVVSAANKMLEMVHGGRYRLFRTDDMAQNTKKRGLELKVYDKYSEDHEGRFVSTLSGGEKFLASLALSIGMSTVAQKSGIKIEALFIDEGFGSLDEDSIVDAMNILNSIQEANGLVGIISHVQLLQDRIPTKLKVEEVDKGSKIVQSIG